MRSIHLVLLAALIGLVPACTRPALFAVNTMAGFGAYTVEKDIAYGPYPENRLDVYQPESTSKGVIVFFYGGCWGACLTVPRGDYRFVAQTLAGLGYTIVIPDYRLYPLVRFAQIMQDAAAAVEWTRLNLENSDPGDLLVLMGHSAGAHIAAMLVANEDYLGAELQQQISGFIGLAGPYDFIYDQPYQYELFAGFEYEQTMPSNFVDGTEPPMLLLHGRMDEKVYMRNINNMTAAVHKHGGQVHKIVYEDMDHTRIIGALSIPLRNRYDVVEDISQFLGEL